MVPLRWHRRLCPACAGRFGVRWPRQWCRNDLAPFDPQRPSTRWPRFRGAEPRHHDAYLGPGDDSRGSRYCCTPPSWGVNTCLETCPNRLCQSFRNLRSRGVLTGVGRRSCHSDIRRASSARRCSRRQFTTQVREKHGAARSRALNPGAAGCFIVHEELVGSSAVPRVRADVRRVWPYSVFMLAGLRVPVGHPRRKLGSGCPRRARLSCSSPRIASALHAVQQLRVVASAPARQGGHPARQRRQQPRRAVAGGTSSSPAEASTWSSCGPVISASTRR